MTSLEVFDPAQCCPTGVCGPSVDPALARFAADLEWLAAQDVVVRRYNLAQEPGAFAAQPLVTTALEAAGEAALPFVLADGAVVSQGRYPTREELAVWGGLTTPVGPTGETEAAGGGCCPPAPEAVTLGQRGTPSSDGGCC